MRRIVFLFVFGLLLGLLAGVAVANGNHDDHHDDDGSDLVTVQTEVANTIKGDSSWGIGAGGPGDVDIDRCWGSTQWGGLTIFRQKLVTIETCLGFEFLAIKQYKLAAMHFCNDNATLKEYTSEANCEFEHDFTPPDTNPNENHGAFEEHYEIAQQQQQEIEYLREENASIVGRLEALTERIERRPVTVSSQVQTQIQRQESDAERRRAGAKEAYLKAKAKALAGSE